jgi:hypothetical protein
MNYSLGNMLNGGESLNADGLSLDLQFATDKTLTARKGPTPTFTRASAATNYGPLVQFGGQTYPATGIVNGRTEWKIVDGSDYKSFEYSGGAWRYTEFFSGEGTTYDSAATSAFRPEQANWSASGLTSSPTTSSTFGIVRVATNEPRFDHNPTTLASLGLLIEESRTNNLTRSDDFAQAVWTKLNTTVTSNNTTSPDGANNADSIFETTALGEHTIYVSGSSLTDATMSVFVKPNGRNNINLRFYAAVNNWVTTTFLLSGSGSITQTASGISSNYTARSQTITQLSNGWYRCTLSANRTGGVNVSSFDSCTTSTPTLIATGAESYTGNASLGVYLWGAQLEAGSFPTSYIPTTTASVVRSVDVCSITGAAFTGFYNQSEGTVFSQTTKTSTNQNAFIVSANNNTFNEDIDLRYNAVTAAQSVVNVSNVNQINGFTRTITSGSSVKQALAYKLNDFAYSVDVTALFTDTVGSIPTVSQMNIGTAYNNTLSLNGHIASIRYYKKRLANSKLQTFTA